MRGDVVILNKDRCSGGTRPTTLKNKKPVRTDRECNIAWVLKVRVLLLHAVNFDPSIEQIAVQGPIEDVADDLRALNFVLRSVFHQASILLRLVETAELWDEGDVAENTLGLPFVVSSDEPVGSTVIALLLVGVIASVGHAGVDTAVNVDGLDSR